MAKANILLVDDEKLIRWSLSECLKGDGYDVTAVETGREATLFLENDSHDLVLLDYKLPDTNGLELLERFRRDFPDTAVVMITSHSSVDHAVDAMRAGAVDYVAKPFRNEDILLRVELETNRLRSRVDRLHQDETRRFGLKNVVGKSDAFEKVLRIVERVLQSNTADATILIQGESGTGKDVLAKALHFEGRRSAGAFLNITCTALPEDLLESELSGHEKGAFTDARTLKKGLVELAEGGSVFLDEIGDMSLHLQSKLLRFLEEKTFRRVGGSKDIHVDVRVIAATNKDLKSLVKEKMFREDLYFRLKVIPIHIPPLRDRKEDIPKLVEHFVQAFNRDLRKNVRGVTASLLKRLEEYHWPGNIRELKNTIERAMILGVGDEIDADDLPIDLLDEPVRLTPDTNRMLTLDRKGIHLETLERNLVQQALDLTHGNQTRAGKYLGLNRDQIRYRVEKFGLNLHRDPDEQSDGE